MELKALYATRIDGAKTAFTSMGNGPVLVCPPPAVSHLEIFHDDPPHARLAERLAERHTLVLYDKHGCGLSDRNRTDFSIEDDIRDLEAVVGALGLERFAVLGSSAGGIISLAYTARHPERVTRLALYGTSAGFASGEHPRYESTLSAFVALVRAHWGLGSRLLATILLGSNADIETTERWTRFERMAATGETAAKLLEQLPDLRPLLSKISTSTLIMHRRDDQTMPFAAARELARLLPNARLVPLEGDVHAPAYGDTESFLRPLLAFLDDAPSDRIATPASVVTVLFTDIVGHTEMMRRLGDAAGREVLREHERITRETLKRHGGVEVKTIGDGFMASFSSVTAAMECAIALQRAFAQHNEAAREPILVRVGLNAGEPIVEDGDFFGTSVILASRVCALASCGEILIPEPVRHLVAGKSIECRDRGQARLQGFDDPIRLYEVNWRN